MLALFIGLFPAGGAADVYYSGSYGLPDLGWTQINPRPVSESLLTVAFGAGRWVAASEHNIYTSEDGVQWQRTAPFQSQMMHEVRVIYTLDRFFLTNGVDGWVSPDGAAWTPTPGLTDLTVSPGGCVAIVKRQLMSAADCQTWVSTSLNEPVQRIGYADGTFFAYGGYDRNLFTSADGSEWAVADPGEWAPAHDYGRSPFLIAGGAFVVTTSEWGTHWPGYPSKLDDVQAVVRGADRFLLLPRDGHVLSSVDGATWREAGALPPGTRWYDMAAGPGGFVAVGEAGAIARSADGAAWELVRQGPAFGWTSVAYGAGRFLAMGQTTDGGLLYRSENGLDWHFVRWLPVSSGELAVAYLGGKFFVYFDMQVIQSTQRPPQVLLSSDDGVAWSEVPEPLKGAEIISRRGALLAVTQEGLLVAEAGQAPRSLPLPTGMTVKAGAFTDDGRYILAGYGGKVAISADGQTWSVGQIPARCNLGGLAAGGGRFVTHCNPGEVYSSADAVTWELVPDVRVYKVDYTGGKFFAIGGNELAVSGDGQTWEQRHQEPGPWAFAYGEGRYVGVGRSGLMLASEGQPATGAVDSTALPDPGRSALTADAQVTVGQPIVVTVNLVDQHGRPLAVGRPVRLWDPQRRYPTLTRLTDAAGRARFVLYYLPGGPGVTFQVEDVLSGRWLNDPITLNTQKCGSRFADVAATDGLCQAVESVAARGLISGYPDGTFRGQEPLTRAQLAKVAALAAGQKPLPGEASPFSDTEGHWAARDGYVQAVAAAGIMQGDPGGKFRPDDPVTRAELIKVIVALAGISPEMPAAGEWYTPWVEAAYKYRLIGSPLFANVYAASEPMEPNRPATRVEAAAVLANLHRYQVSMP